MQAQADAPKCVDVGESNAAQRGGASKASAIFPKETLEFIELKMDGTRAVDLCNTESQTTARTTNAQQHASRATPAPQSLGPFGTILGACQIILDPF